MKNKCINSLQHAQHLIAGLLLEDSGIEFYGLPETKEVQWIQNGHGHCFKDLNRETFAILSNALQSNLAAREHLDLMVENGEFIKHRRKVELYTYFMYGGLDCNPDFKDGQLKTPENYRHSRDCVSLNFKPILLNGSPLHQREITMLDLIADGLPDKAIAPKMNIAIATYNYHKRNLFTKAGIEDRISLVFNGIRQRILTTQTH